MRRPFSARFALAQVQTGTPWAFVLSVALLFVVISTVSCGPAKVAKCERACHPHAEAK